MAIADKLTVTEITTEKIAGVVFLYASSILIRFVGSFIDDISQLPGERHGIASVLVHISTILLFIALVATVYFTGDYLLNLQ